ncbi:energy-coupling factor ABC transporter permease [Anaeromyxobacter diazotrophicus]|nr:energy-coupling factor ABC transporter permease [Anaeromyxobacter diazotrophicus]
MSDALVSPAVGGALWLTAAGVARHAARRLEREEEQRLPLMGVLGAFVFAAQMVNFAIPGTGSSGHLGGGLLLAVLLGPHAAFVVMASVLTVQALFFADGGLLALGCNAVNLGFFASYLAYPLVWRPLAGDGRSPARVALASVAAAVAGLQLGALAVVVETRASGISSLPFGPFLLLMQSIHLAIGLVEGAVTAAVVLAVRRARPELAPAGTRGARSVVALGTAALVAAGALSWFASTRPDGLEWAAARAASGAPQPAAGAAHALAARLQRATAVMPDYAPPGAPDGGSRWGAPRAGTSAAGLLGVGLSVAFVVAAGLGARALRRRAARRP